MIPPSTTLARIEIMATNTGNPYYGKKGWVQIVSARSILDVAMMANVPNIGQVKTGQIVLVLDDGTGAAFDDFGSFDDTMEDYKILP